MRLRGEVHALEEGPKAGVGAEGAKESLANAKLRLTTKRPAPTRLRIPEGFV